MKNANASIINKVGDINVEVMTVSRKLTQIESYTHKLDEEIKEEASLRQNVEKKTFLMNETFKTKIDGLSKGFDAFTELMTNQLQVINEKFMENQHQSSEQLIKECQGALERLESYETNSNELYADFHLFKSETNTKIESVEDVLRKDIQEIKKQILDRNNKIEALDEKVTQDLDIIRNDIGDIVKDVSTIKNEIEMFKNFKQNTILNFGDISDEFVRNDKEFKKFTNSIYSQIAEFDSKINLFDQTFNMHNDNFINIKKDIYNQIYDNNLTINNRFKDMNDTFLEKFEQIEKMNQEYQSSLLLENEKFSDYLTEKSDGNFKNIKKLIDYSYSELDLVKERVKIFI